MATIYCRHIKKGSIYHWNKNLDPTEFEIINPTALPVPETLKEVTPLKADEVAKKRGRPKKEGN